MALSGHEANFSQARIKRRAAGEPSGYVRGTKNKSLLLKATKIQKPFVMQYNKSSLAHFETS